ncbi:MAG: hypothetical protein PHR28_02520 [candidate division Zixibacteria bacterium]|nr:hypothetical protein [candidate division Zixibacteria bacterium]
MKMKRVATLVCIIGALAIMALVISCSDKTFTTTNISDPSETATPSYAPLEPGLRVSFSILGQNGRSFDMEIGDSIMVDGNHGFQVRQVDHETQATTITYRYMKGNALFESASVNDPGVRILEGPFVAGHSWNRNDTWSTNDSLILGEGDDGGTGGGDIRKVLAPVYMNIVGFEDVQTLNGDLYSRTLKVAWPVDENHTNYYWYAQGIGMIKYEEGFMRAAPDAATTIALMTDFQRVKY